MAVLGQSAISDESNAEFRIYYKHTSVEIVIKNVTETQDNEWSILYIYGHRCNLHKIKI